MKYPDARILVFCRAPVPGEVKTRLVPALGESGASALHQELASRVINAALASELAPVALWCEPAIDHPFFHGYESRGVSLHAQSGADLGMRMHDALSASLEDPAVGRAVLVGTDLPTLNSEYLENAIELLAEHDAVIGPAEDGGYGLIGLRSAAPAIFDRIEWGGDQVCADTCRQFNRLGWHWALLPLLWDVDRPADVERFHALRD